MLRVLKKYCLRDVDLPTQLECGSSRSLYCNGPSKETHVLPGNKDSQVASVSSMSLSGGEFAPLILDTRSPKSPDAPVSASNWNLFHLEAHLWVFLAHPIYTWNGEFISHAKLIHFKGLFRSLPLFYNYELGPKWFRILCQSPNYSKLLLEEMSFRKSGTQ